MKGARGETEKERRKRGAAACCRKEGRGNMDSSRPAEQWLVIAEKLLGQRDLVGSKTFATRARETDPRLELADRILAVADTLTAGEVRINNQHDWYSVLQLDRLTRDSELIATQYRRLALLLNPEKIKLPCATEALKLVDEAWSVLSDPTKKTLYDNELNRDDSSGSTQRQQQPIRRSARKRVMKEKLRAFYASQSVSSESERVTISVQSTPPTFWTACPYCYHIYEYPKIYEDCTLKCQICQKAFHALLIEQPPLTRTGKTAYFCSWGYFPLGFSLTEFSNTRDAGGSYSWNPISPMFICPFPANNVRSRKHMRNDRPKAIIIDDDDEVLMEVSEPSEESDDEWGSNSRKKKKKKVKNGPKRKGLAARNAREVQGRSLKMGGSQNVTPQENAELPPGGVAMRDGSRVGNAQNVANDNAGTSRKFGSIGNSSKKHSMELGKLDLNVEFSNEVEEPAPGMSHENGGEDNIEGIGFFEGLDEFLSTLPILSAVGDDKVKAN